MFVVFIFRIVRAFWVYDFSKFSIRKYSKYSTTAKKEGTFYCVLNFFMCFCQHHHRYLTSFIHKEISIFCANLGAFLNRLIYSSHSDKRGPMNVWVFERFLLHSHLQKRFRANVIWVCQFGHFLRKACWMCEKLNRFCLLVAFVLYADSVKKITTMSPLKLSTFQLG